MKPHIKLKTPHGTIAPTAEQLSSQIAVLSRFGMGGFGGWLPNPDPILRKLGRQIDVYRELLRDPLVGGQVRRRKATVARLQWRLDGDDVPPNVRNTVQAALEQHDLDRLIKDILNATLFGYQPIEIIWRRDSLWLPEKIIAKPPEWFGFDDNAQLYFHQNGATTEPLPAYKFLCPTQEASYDNPYGLGDLGLVFWAVTFKRAGLKFWAEFTQKYGSPWLIGKEPRSNTDADTNKLLDALEALVGNAVGTIPNDSSVEIHEASGKAASVDAYDKLIRYCRSEINIALLGQDQTTEANTNHASATAGLEVTDDIRDSDSRIVAAAINQLIEWICELNFGDVTRPKFVLYEAEEYGSTELAQRDYHLHQIGARFSNEYFARAYGFQDGDLLPTERQPENDLGSLNFAEPHAHHEHNEAANIPHIMETAVSGSLKANPPDVTHELIGSLKHGTTSEAVLQQLAAAYPKLDHPALQDELARLIFLANVVGRLEAQAELEEA
nr:MAG TPA: portal [Caudoviricetes sp.]